MRTVGMAAKPKKNKKEEANLSKRVEELEEVVKTLTNEKTELAKEKETLSKRVEELEKATDKEKNKE